MELEIVKATPATQEAAAPPGTVGAVSGPCLRVACADKEIWIHTVRAEGRYQNAVDVLRPGDRMRESPEMLRSVDQEMANVRSAGEEVA